MDNNLPTTSINESDLQKQSWFSRLQSKNLRILIIILAFLALGTGALVANYTITNTPPTTDNNTAGLVSPTVIAYPTKPVYVQSNADGTIVYGLWSPSLTEIKIVNTDGTNDFPIALLPAKIKDVHVLSNSTLLYINDTDAYDHGKTIELYKTDSRKTENLVSSNPGWGIDDMIVSPDRDYIAWWEVKFAPNKKRLSGGQSRVYLKNINTGETSLVADEISSSDSPIHYPFFFDHNNRLFMDTFIPNQGRGFYLGVDYVTPDNPIELIPVPALTRGKFSSNPVLSPTENMIVYSGFDPNASKIFNNTTRENPKRVELDNLNQVILLDLDTFRQKIIANSSSNYQYSNTIFSSDGENIIFLASKLPSFGYKEAEVIIGIYNLKNQSISYQNDPSFSSKNIIDYVNNTLYFADTESANIANLGEKYSFAVKNFTSLDSGNTNSNAISQQSKMQFITLLSRKGKSDKLILLNQPSTQPTSENDSSLQLSQVLIPQTPDLDYRTGAQNDPPSNTKKTTNPDATPTYALNPSNPCNYSSRNPADCDLSCLNLVISVCGSTEIMRSSDSSIACNGNYSSSCCQTYLQCFDSPLYLYPEKTSSIYVEPRVSNKIYASKPNLTDNSWNVIAQPNGIILDSFGKTYNRIDYTYLSDPQAPPERGILSAASDLIDNLNYYGSKVGLHDQELNDFVNFWNKNLTRYDSPYYFISHYDRETASKIMSFEITPKVDTFIQVIMYFKPLQYPISVSPPVFEEIPQRRGFTAVDWSGKIEP